MEHEYKEIKASVQQKRKFFALCKDLGYEAEASKERAKAKYGLGSFSDATQSQLNELIDSLQKKADKQIDDQIVSSGKYIITICHLCGGDCIVRIESAKSPVCTRLECVREFYRREK